MRVSKEQYEAALEALRAEGAVDEMDWPPCGSVALRDPYRAATLRISTTGPDGPTIAERVARLSIEVRATMYLYPHRDGTVHVEAKVSRTLTTEEAAGLTEPREVTQ